MTWQMAWQVWALLLTWAGVAATSGVLGARAALRNAARRREARRAALLGDPVSTLELQERLGAMARELQELGNRREFAAVHHWRAAQGAYDALLREACRRAGLPGADGPLVAGERTAAVERFEAELELSARGWTW